MVSRTNKKQLKNIESKRRPATLTINFVSFVRIVYFLVSGFISSLLFFLWEVICGFEQLNTFPTEYLLVHGPSELISILPERIHTIIFWTWPYFRVLKDWCIPIIKELKDKVWLTVAHPDSGYQTYVFRILSFFYKVSWCFETRPKATNFDQI